MTTIAETPTADLKLWLERLEAETLLRHSKRVEQTIRVKIRAIELTLEERHE